MDTVWDVIADPDVIAALEVALERDPGNLALAVHLAELLLQADSPDEALARAESVLAVAPVDPAALQLRDRAARLVAEPAPPGLRVLDGGLSR